MDIDALSCLFQFEGTKAASIPVKLLGIRGYFLDEGKERDNDLGIYDDLIVSCIEDKVTAFRASTDPGQYYVDHPLSPLGCAQLQCGLWSYRVGLHREKNEAFVQADEVAVNRLDSHGKIIARERGWFGINIHSGGAAYEVGKFSAGCQIVQCPESAWGATWLNFFNPVKAAMLKHEQKVVPYLLTDKLKAIPCDDAVLAP